MSLEAKSGPTAGPTGDTTLGRARVRVWCARIVGEIAHERGWSGVVDRSELLSQDTPHVLGEGGVVPLPPRDAHHRDAQPPSAGELEQRREHLLASQVAGGAEEDDRVRAPGRRRHVTAFMRPNGLHATACSTVHGTVARTSTGTMSPSAKIGPTAMPSLRYTSSGTETSAR